MSRWSDDHEGYARPQGSARFPDERLPGDPVPSEDADNADPHGPEFSAPRTNAAPRPASDSREDEGENGGEDAPKSFLGIELTLPTMIIIGSLVLALVISGGLFLRSQRIQQQAGPDGPMPGAEETQLIPREGEPPEVQVAEVGDRVHVQGLYGTGWITVVTADWADDGNIDPTRGAYLNIDLLVETEEGTMVVESIQYAAYDLEGNQYVPSIGAAKEPYLNNQEVTGSGSEARGWVSFDVPRGPTRLEISDEGFNPLVTIDFIPPA